jgi:D-beta-D-heptose 7-phosphate kinase/D-beta-D-heptose 1-phosphate adenosyltransferase
VIDRRRARALVAGFADCPVLVLGDLMLDRYVWGDVSRISPEAPIPVVRVDRESTMLGGAGNVARNLASLGARACIVSLVGADDPAAQLRTLLDGYKIPDDGLIVDGGRQTTQKTRVIARGQQLVRYDHETEAPIASAIEAHLLDQLHLVAAQVRGAVVQDYGKGLLTPSLVAQALAIFRERGVRVFVDPKRPPWHGFAGVELLKPNAREAEDATGRRIRTDLDIEAAIRAVRQASRAQAVAITRSESGMTLLWDDAREPVHVPTVPVDVADPAGAGDTAISVLALARLAGADWLEAAQLANAAGRHVVGMRGTATLTQEDLLRELPSR